MSTEVRRFPSLVALSRAAADEVVAIIEQALAARGRAFVALSGGSTPKTLYADLATRRLDWTRVTLFWSDERAVPPDHADSNFRLAKEALFDHLPRLVAHRMHGEAADLQAAAGDYERQILKDIPGRAFDLILLGLGPDGHTASLFPGSAALSERQRLVTANVVPSLETTRLTFTFPLLNAARNVLFLVAGKNKAPAVAQVLEGPPGTLPAQGINAARVVWFVDIAAASRLRNK